MNAPRIFRFDIVLLIVSGPALAGPPYRTDDPEPVPVGKWEINVASIGTWTRQATSLTSPSIDANYGAAADLQLHLMATLDYGTTTGGPTGVGSGDLELGAKYRLFMPEEGDWRPQLAVYPLLEVPVGNTRLGFGTGHPQLFLPIWLQKDFGAWTVYGGGGYWLNPGAGNRDHWFVGAVLLRKIGDSLTVGLELFHQTSSAPGVPDSTGYNVGMTYEISEQVHVLTAVGSGLENVATTNQFSWYAGLQLTF